MLFPSTSMRNENRDEMEWNGGSKLKKSRHDVVVEINIIKFEGKETTKHTTSSCQTFFRHTWKISSSIIFLLFVTRSSWEMLCTYLENNNEKLFVFPFHPSTFFHPSKKTKTDVSREFPPLPAKSVYSVQ